LENCHKVKEFIVENVVVQKSNLKTSAKLYNFLHKSDKLDFDASQVILREITITLFQRYLDEYTAWQIDTEKSSSRSYEDTLEGLLEFWKTRRRDVKDQEISRVGEEVESNNVAASFSKILALASTTSYLPKP
jgi:hypothetical protein